MAYLWVLLSCGCTQQLRNPATADLALIVSIANGTRISRMNTDFIAESIEFQMRCWLGDAIEAFGLSMLVAGTVG
jgi:hypothetical protein